MGSKWAVEGMRKLGLGREGITRGILGCAIAVSSVPSLSLGQSLLSDLRRGQLKLDAKTCVCEENGQVKACSPWLASMDQFRFHLKESVTYGPGRVGQPTPFGDIVLILQNPRFMSQSRVNYSELVGKVVGNKSKPVNPIMQTASVEKRHGPDFVIDGFRYEWDRAGLRWALEETVRHFAKRASGEIEVTSRSTAIEWVDLSTELPLAQPKESSEVTRCRLRR